MYKVDLHTHSEASPDGGITAEQYAKILETEALDYIAITDHDRVDFALGMQKALGNRIIVGEEISTVEGEIIGLFLTEKIEPNLSVEETIAEIRRQNGLVYIPHPFEKVRRGLKLETLNRIVDSVNIVEVFNGRARFRTKHAIVAATWAKRYLKGCASSSDAHGFSGVGRTYSVLDEIPNVGSLQQNLVSNKLVCRFAPTHSLLYPKYNRIKKIINGGW